jgi:hypothetical protein
MPIGAKAGACGNPVGFLATPTSEEGRSRAIFAGVLGRIIAMANARHCANVLSRSEPRLHRTCTAFTTDRGAA